MARIFVYEGREYPDPDQALTVEEVRQLMADHLPELNNADTREEKRGEDTLYYFSRRIGTKGAGDVVDIIRSVPEKRLAIFELAAHVITSTGDIDFEAVEARQPEFNLARGEVEWYAKDTQRAVEAIRALPPR